MKTARLTGSAALLAAATAAGIGAAPAHAEYYFANCMVSSEYSTTCQTGLEDWTTASRGVYRDETNVLCAYDDADNGKSGIAVYWPKGKPNQKKRLWAHTGKGSKKCTNLGGKPENAAYVVQACIGEWAKSPANRVITSCGQTRPMTL